MITRPRHRSAGFTLIEVLVGMSVASLVLVLMGQTQRLGLRSVARQAGVIREGKALRTAESTIHSVLAHMDPGTRANPLTPRAGENGILLRTRLPNSVLAGDRGQNGVPVTAELLARDGRLVLRWSPLLPGVATDTREVLLAQGVARLEMGYRGAGGTWMPVWPGPGNPWLVRARLVWADPDQRAWPPFVVAPLRPRPRD